MIPYGKHFITDDDIQAVVNVLKGDFLTQGPTIESFEKEFAEYVGSKYAIAVSNGTAALHLSAIVLNCKPGQRVITTPITFAASANCIRYCGADVYFCDIDADSYLMDLDKLEDLLSSKPKGYFSGVIPVDFAGLPIDIVRLRSLCDEHGLWLLHDTCHSPGAALLSDSGEILYHSGDGKNADLSIFSFHPVKHIAAGEGGMITTNNPEYYHRLKILRSHGITKNSDQFFTPGHPSWYYEMKELGYNYRLTDIQAALGLSQLKKANDRLIRRKKIAEVYVKSFQGKIKFQSVRSNQSHAYHLFVIEVPNRDLLYHYLKENGIFAQVHYIPVHQHPYYQKLYPNLVLSSAESYYSRCLSLPMYPELLDHEQENVTQKVLNFYDFI